LSEYPKEWTTHGVTLFLKTHVIVHASRPGIQYLKGSYMSTIYSYFRLEMKDSLYPELLNQTRTLLILTSRYSNPLFLNRTRRQCSNHFKVLVLEEWQKIAKTREQKGHWHRG